MLLLRPYRAEDLDPVRGLFAARDEGDLQWFGFRAPTLAAQFAEHGFLTPEAGRLVVEEDGQFAGSVQWLQRSWGPPTTSWCWEIGISLVPERRGRGVGTRAQVLLRDYLLDHTRADRVQAVTDVQNVAEQRALEGAGFTREGRVRGAQWREGAWHDQYLYGFLRSDR